MGWLLLIAAVLVAAVLIGRAFRPSEQTVARKILKARLRDFGLDPQRFSEACLDELLYLTMRTHRIMGRPSTNVEGLAVAIAGICFGDRGCTAEEIKADLARGLGSPHWEILAKHDPGRFSLEQLERTQLFNRVGEEAKRDARQTLPPQ
jgi:hypothetical protein